MCTEDYFSQDKLDNQSRYTFDFQKQLGFFVVFFNSSYPSIWIPNHNDDDDNNNNNNNDNNNNSTRMMLLSKSTNHAHSIVVFSWGFGVGGRGEEGEHISKRTNKKSIKV